MCDIALIVGYKICKGIPIIFVGESVRVKRIVLHSVQSTSRCENFCFRTRWYFFNLAIEEQIGWWNAFLLYLMEESNRCKYIIYRERVVRAEGSAKQLADVEKKKRN